MTLIKHKHSVELIWVPLLILLFGIGASRELWYITRKNGGRVYHLFHVGFADIPSPDRIFVAHTMCITIIYLTFKVGFITRSKS